MLSKHIAWKSREQMKIQKEYLKIKWKKIVKVLDRYLYKEGTQWPFRAPAPTFLVLGLLVWIPILYLE